MTVRTHETDVLIVGWGLSGLVAAREALRLGKRVTIVDQEPRTNLGGQAWWSFGGLFFIDSRSEEHTSELQSLMRISYAVFCLKKKKTSLHIPDLPLLNHHT